MRCPGRIVFIAFLTLAHVLPARAGEARDDLVALVRHLGYGAAIHDYKNYVLRAHAQFHEGAKRGFEQALASAARLATARELDDADREAVAAIERTVRGYLDALAQIRAHREKRRRIEDVDDDGRVDDSDAIRALQRLRARWPWTSFEEVEFLIGYGGGIHAFKNYVLRGDPAYRDHAAARLAAATSRLSSLIEDVDADESQQRAALEAVRDAVTSYAGMLPVIEEMRGAGRTVRQVDLAVKIDDGPAKAALARLRAAPP